MVKEFNNRYPVIHLPDESMPKEPNKEFNLSEKIREHYPNDIPQENVKEFIKRDEILINMWVAGEISEDEFWKRRNEMAGDSLIYD